MSQPTCEPLVAIIQKLAQDLGTIDDQLQAFEVEGMSRLHPWRYFALQPQVNRLIKKKHALQDACNDAMSELALCRLGQPSPHRP